MFLSISREPLISSEQEIEGSFLRGSEKNLSFKLDHLVAGFKRYFSGHVYHIDKTDFVSFSESQSYYSTLANDET